VGVSAVEYAQSSAGRAEAREAAARKAELEARAPT
jgi:hypothetical protein